PGRPRRLALALRLPVRRRHAPGSGLRVAPRARRTRSPRARRRLTAAAVAAELEGTRGVERAWALPSVLTPDRIAALVIGVVVLAANALVLVGGFDPNPMSTRSELATGLTGRVIPGETTIDPNDGFISQALGHRAALDVLHLRMPWWDSDEATGAPLAAGM